MSEHTQRYPYCKVTYWKDNSASTSEEAYTHCKVTPLGMYSYGEQSFPNTSEGKSNRDRLLSFLEEAYELGRSHAKREIREVLGVKEPRS